MMQTPRLALWPESKSHPLIRYVKKGWTINRTFKMTNIVNLMYSHHSLLLLQLVNSEEITEFHSDNNVQEKIKM